MPITAVTPTAGRLDVGDTWHLTVVVHDDETGDLAAATVAATVTLPDDTTTAPPVEADDMTGLYGAEYVLAAPGRHFAVLSSSAPGPVSVVTFAVTAEEPSGLPGLVALKAYLEDSAAQWTDPELQGALDAETAAQARVCRVGAIYPADLREALLRRVQRNLAMRALPLAVLQGDAEVGTSTVLPGRDPEVRRLEAPHRKLRVG